MESSTNRTDEYLSKTLQTTAEEMTLMQGKGMGVSASASTLYTIGKNNTGDSLSATASRNYIYIYIYIIYRQCISTKDSSREKGVD